MAYQIGKGMGPIKAYLSIDEVIRVARSAAFETEHRPRSTLGKSISEQESRLLRCDGLDAGILELNVVF